MKMETVSQNACASGEKKRGKRRRRSKGKPAIDKMETASQNACASGEKKRGGKRRRNKEKRPIKEPYQYLKVTKKVLKSDEALWALYEQWCCQCRPYRTAEDKQMRFPFFKKTAFRIRERNQKSPSGGSGLTCWSDLTDEEREKRSCCGFGCSHTAEERRRRQYSFARRMKRNMKLKEPVNAVEAVQEDKDQEA